MRYPASSIAALLLAVVGVQCATLDWTRHSPNPVVKRGWEFDRWTTTCHEGRGCTKETQKEDCGDLVIGRKSKVDKHVDRSGWQRWTTPCDYCNTDYVDSWWDRFLKAQGAYTRVFKDGVGESECRVNPERMRVFTKGYTGFTGRAKRALYLGRRRFERSIGLLIHEKEDWEY